MTVQMKATENADKAFLQEAVQLAIESVNDGGAPFGAVVVHEGKVIARAGNRAKLDRDATAHAEVAAIRKAGKMLKNAHMPEATQNMIADLVLCLVGPEPRSKCYQLPKIGFILNIGSMGITQRWIA